MFRRHWSNLLVFFIVVIGAVGPVAFSRILQVYVPDSKSTLPHAALDAHNKYRTLHHAPPLNWSESMATQAQALAQSLLARDNLGNRQDASTANLGQNLAKLAGSMTCDDAGEIATNLWYSQVRNYSYSDPRLNLDTDTFTQVVWKDTKDMGIGCARDAANNSGPLYVVALYRPAGNIPRLLRDNVLVPGPRGKNPDVYSTLFRRQFNEAKSLGLIHGHDSEQLRKTENEINNSS